MSILRRIATGAAVATLSLTVLSACSGDDEQPSTNPSADADGDDEVTPEEVLGYAKTILDETSGVRLSLSTADDVESDAFLSSAEGVITADPQAFEGTASGSFEGLPASDVEIISIDGATYVNLFGGFQDFDLPDCVPDPATLLDPDDGVTNVLSQAEDVEAGEPVRGGANNDEILTPYTATVPGEAIQSVLPCAPGATFDATFTIEADGALKTAELTGDFFGADDLTYTIEISEYDVEQEISKP